MLSAGLVLWRAYRIRDAESRAWRVLGVGVLSWSFGFIALTVQAWDTGVAPYPSISDFFWLPFYPAAYIAVIMLLRLRVRRLPSALWFQGPIAFLGFSALAAALLFEPIKDSTGGDVLTLVLSLIYPINDLIMVGIVLTAAVITVIDAAVSAVRTARLRSVSRLDSLTGLLNYAALHAAINDEVTFAERHRTILSVVFFDLDGFKEVNDTLGHAEGDRVLCATAAALARACREVDAAARIGGDEFALVLSACSRSTAADVAVRVRDAVRDSGEGLDISYGVAEYPVDGADREALLRCADARLYVEKSTRTAA